MTRTSTSPINDERIPDYLQRVIGYSSPTLWIRERINELLDLTKQSAPPIDLKPLLRLRRILAVKYDSSLGCRAKLIPVERGFEIRVDESLRYRFRRENWRFTIAHEIGHTFFYDLDTVVPRRYPGIPVGNIPEERFCDLFACELLMPQKLMVDRFRPEIFEEEQSCDHSLFKSVFKIQREFDVSLGSICLRIVKDLSLWRCLLILCRWLPKFPVRSSGDEQREMGDHTWRIVWSVLPDTYSKEIFFPRPRNYRLGLPKLRFKILADLNCEMKHGEIREIDVPRTEFQKLGNLLKFLRRSQGEKSHYKVLVGMIRRGEAMGEIFSPAMGKENALLSIKGTSFLVGVPLRRSEKS